MDGEMPNYLLAKDLILQVSLTDTSGVSFIFKGHNLSAHGIYSFLYDLYWLFTLLMF